MFVDASAIIAIITGEPEKETLSSRLMESGQQPFVSPIVIYEAVLGLSRKGKCSLVEARTTLDHFIAAIGAVTIPVNDAIGDTALDAHARFGKGRHKAALNMGDCFAYACAKVHNVPLLFKGDDFVHTDIAVA